MKLLHGLLRGLPILMLLLTGCDLFRAAEDELKPGSRAFFFDKQQAVELELAKSNPATGDAWSATAIRQSFDPPVWEIRSGPGGKQLVDRIANGSFLAHLIDTLTTLQVFEAAPKGPPEGFGLRPPRFAIRLKLEPGITREIHIGAPEPKSGGAWISLANPQSSPRITLVKGAALQMLGHLSSFDEFRQRTMLAPLAADDIDEVELFLRGKSYFYAQREGDIWTDRRNKPLRGSKADVSIWLERLVHSRAQAFIDDPVLSEKLLGILSSRPRFEALLKDRTGKATRLRVDSARVGSQDSVIAEASSRPGAVFVSYPELPTYFDTFRK
ncbi:MAG: DUF4340 domain-containing protein [Oligoflexia bacterium]|nr:DUF4340 domain-containing protein [Oligoflexia bacterium]